MLDHISEMARSAPLCFVAMFNICGEVETTFVLVTLNSSEVFCAPQIFELWFD